MTLLKIANKIGAASSRDRAKMALLKGTWVVLGDWYCGVYGIS